MDDDSKQILLLKIGVAFLVFLAILIFVVIIISVKNANKKNSNMETTTRRTLSGEVEDITSTSWFSEEITSSSETTTTSTSTTTVAPETTTTTTKKQSSSGGGSSSSKKPSNGGGGSSSSGSSSQSEIPSHTYTVIGSNDSTSYHNADNSMEWNLFNKINSNTNNKYKMALELRTAAERIAQTCCEAPGSCNEASKQLVDSEYQLTFRSFMNGTATYTTNFFYENLVNDKLLKGNYKYIGVGVIKGTGYFSCAAWIVDGD